MAIGAILAAALQAGQMGLSLYDSYQRKKATERARRARASYFDTQLKPLLDEAINIERPDFDAIKEAELANPIFQMQRQMEDLFSQRMNMHAKSGFSSSGFINKLIDNQEDVLAMNMDEKLYQTNRMIQDMQSQFDDMINQNKLRAKELEYSYKFG